MMTLGFSLKNSLKYVVIVACFFFPILSQAHNCFHDACSNHIVLTSECNMLSVGQVLNFSKNITHQMVESVVNMIPPGNRQFKLRTIVLDAGHGGKDSGCLGKDSKEKDLTLEYVLNLGAMIESAYPDIQVVYTRKTDVFIELHERANIANHAKADLFISIHCNWNPNTSPYGTETYVLGLHRAKDNLEVAKRENSSIFLENNYEKNYAGFDPNSPEGNILMTMSQNAHLTQSISIAEKIEKEFEHKSNRKSRGVRQAGFLVLRATSMPAVLIETGFLSNTKEEDYMTSAKGKKEIVENIFRGFEKFKANVEFSAPDDNGLIAKSTATPQVRNETVKQGVGVEQNSSKVDELSILSKQNTNENNTSNLVEICVQLEATKSVQDLEQKKWEPFSNIIARSENNALKYQVVCNSMEEARTVKTKAKENGFPEAFICAYRNGERVSLDEVVENSIGLR